MSSPKKNRQRLTDQQMLIVARKLCDKAGLFFGPSRYSSGFRLFRKCEFGNGERKVVLIAEPKTPSALLRRVKQATGSVSPDAAVFSAVVIAGLIGAMLPWGGVA